MDIIVSNFDHYNFSRKKKMRGFYSDPMCVKKDYNYDE